MKPVFKGIIKRLHNKGTLTFNQFKSVQKFLIREPQFNGFDVKLLVDYFFPIIEIPPNPLQSVKYPKPHNLETLLGC